MNPLGDEHFVIPLERGGILCFPTFMKGQSMYLSPLLETSSCLYLKSS